MPSFSNQNFDVAEPIIPNTPGTVQPSRKMLWLSKNKDNTVSFKLSSPVKLGWKKLDDWEESCCRFDDPKKYVEVVTKSEEFKVEINSICY